MFRVLAQVDLQPYNTLAVPAKAAWFAEIHSRDELLAALRWRRERCLPLLVLGGGSNVVLAADFPGLVLKISLLGLSVVAEDAHSVWLKAGAGENWHKLVLQCLRRRNWGLENLSLIPGSVGAAPVQNIGAYGVELRDVFWELEAVDIDSSATLTLDRQSCEFGYRDSVFKRSLKDRCIITAVTLKLDKQPRLNLSYPGLREALEETGCPASPQLISELVCRMRSAKLPAPEEVPNVGSFFKNPLVDLSTHSRLLEQYPDLVAYPVPPSRVKLAAGWLIEQAGWRGAGDGVAVHEHQALVLVNPGRCGGERVLELAAAICRSVRSKFSVELELEPRVYP